ncbi:unnamed protein product [Caenorhabditis nigoni]
MLHLQQKPRYPIQKLTRQSFPIQKQLHHRILLQRQSSRKTSSEASLAIEKMNKTGDKTIPIKNFNLLIGSMIVCLEENRIGFHQIYSPSVSPVH